MALVTRQRIEEIERATLAPYAVKASESRGRVYPQDESPFRTCFQRDYDRIVHSKAFRRMEYKTQVFVNSVGDHYRTRLTHSMEVAQVCRGVARMLGLNDTVAEAVALAHDLGHPPFGHAGESALDALLAEQGGFNHNAQSLRVIDILESRYPAHPGLNLSYEIREGIAKHISPGAVFDRAEFPLTEAPTLEAAIVDFADEIAYNSHDIDDGLAMGLFTLNDLGGVRVCATALELSQRERPSLDADMRRYDMIRRIVSRQVNDLAEVMSSAIEKLDIRSLTDARRRRIAGFSPALKTELEELRSFLTQRLYHHPVVDEMAQEGRRIVTELFEYFTIRPLKMPDSFRRRVHSEPIRRIVCDFVAGMTDRYADSLVERTRSGTFTPF